MKPVAAAVAGALISGVAMYTVGARTATVDAFTPTPGVVTLDGQQYLPATQLVSNGGFRTVSQPLVTQPVRNVRTAQTARRTVYRDAQPSRNRVVYDDGASRRERVYNEEERQSDRSWQKSAMIIGGSAASGAGVGAIAGGTKGAMIGAAIGGGAASIYEATRRR